MSVVKCDYLTCLPAGGDMAAQTRHLPKNHPLGIINSLLFIHLTLISMMNGSCSTSCRRDVGLLALRVAVGLIFIAHGWGKLQGIEATSGYFMQWGFPAPVFFAWLVGLVEFVGGLAVLFGVYIRAAAKMLAITMIVALLAVHARFTGWMQAELPFALLGSTLALLTLGGGNWVVTKKDCACKMCLPTEAEGCADAGGPSGACCGSGACGCKK